MWCHGEVRQYVAAFTACFSVLVSGSCFGWVTPILGLLLSPGSPIPMTQAQSSWMVAIIEVGNVLSPIPSSFLADRWGRRPSILLTGPLYFLSWLIVIAWPSIQALYFARLLQGVAMGIVFTVVPLYLSEIASPSIRGSISSMFHNCWYLGHLIEYCIGPFLSYHMYTYVTAALPVIAVAIFWNQPETPYYLLMRRNEPAAAAALARLRGRSNTNAVNKELQSMIQSVTADVTNKASWRDIVSTSADRRALYIVIGLGIIRVLNGLIALMTYPTQTFSQIHALNSDNSTKIVAPNNMTILFGVVLFISSFFVTIIADLSGRRQLLMFSCIGAGVNLFLAGCYFYLDTQTVVDVTHYSWFPVAVIVVFSLFVSLGVSPVSVMYQSEMFLSNTRGFASSISAINLTLNAFFVLKFYLVITDALGLFSVFWMFATVCFFGSFWIYFTVPETKGKTFAEIRQELNASLQKNGKPLDIPTIEISDVHL
ncbi:facilitated trehalose transporter Tret1-like [Macrosteles quadrilineatus]|uniref:facilitated trehalose transporter Tret1-like n=1 Tax=Macrosteles quadrilineatus TaxID=74068 RepID=UPI0023E21E6C|nr:facilitated trehalose transporter Tret1-like [Macrosteles quadrilineatus]